jgi:hypothetical protein
MAMIKNIKILFLFLISCGIMTSCIQETYPDGGVIVEEPSIEELLNGLPADLSAAGVSGFYASTGFHVDFGLPSLHIMTDCMVEDLVVCGESNYFQYNSYAMNLDMGPTGAYASYPYLIFYQGIRSANEIIARIDPETEDTQEQYWLGQALAYRAMFYLDLARLYEPKQNLYVPVDMALEGLTVPKVTEKTTPSEAADNRRMHREDMYEFILNNLSVAEKCFAAASMPESVTRPSLYGVYGLFARAYMEMAYWGPEIDKEACGKVVEYADKVIAAFTPLNETQWHDPSNGFNRSASNSAWVWALSLDSSMTNNLFNFTAMMSPEAQFSYAQFTMPGINAWLYEQMPDADFRKSSWYRSGSGLDYKYAGTLEDAAQTKLYAREYMSLKFRPAQGNCTDYSVGVAAEHPLMRVEEMYFLKMEAQAYTDLAAADELLESFMNTFRYRDGSYVCDAADVAAFMDEMMVQKRIEFWGEGLMIYDYKRQNRGITRDYKGSVATNFTGDYLLNTTGRSPQWNFCIPLSELQSNIGITSDDNNPDPTGFTGDPQKTL